MSTWPKTTQIGDLNGLSSFIFLKKFKKKNNLNEFTFPFSCSVSLELLKVGFSVWMLFFNVEGLLLVESLVIVVLLVVVLVINFSWLSKNY